MEQENNENLNSLNEENQDDLGALQERLQKVEEANRQLFERAKKAEGELKDFKKEPSVEPKKSGELDYGQLAYLKAFGIEEEEDVNYLVSESQTTGKSLKDLMGFKYIKEHLKEAEDIRSSREGTPTSANRTSSPARSSADYWIAKGQMPPLDQPELRREVVKLRLKQEEAVSKFSSTPVVGG